MNSVRLLFSSSLYVLSAWQGNGLLEVLNELDFPELRHTDSDEVPWNREDSHSGSTSNIVPQQCFKNGPGLVRLQQWGYRTQVLSLF